MADPRRARGVAGEDAAAELLARAGYELIVRNFRTRYGELDIVAVDGDALVFCEVRTRLGAPSRAIEFALESIGPHKQLQLRRWRASGSGWPTEARPTRDAIASTSSPWPSQPVAACWPPNTSGKPSDPPASASCVYAIDANDSRWIGEMPRATIAARCSGVE